MCRRPGAAAGSRSWGAGDCRHRVSPGWTWLWILRLTAFARASPRSKRLVRPAHEGRGACTFDPCWSAVSRSWHCWPLSSRRRGTGRPAAWWCAASRAWASPPCSTELVSASGEATVLRTRGLEVEAPLAFAALHRLLRPVTRLRDALPAPQARALRVAFGEEDGPSVEPFLVGIATLTVLTAAAEENLVVCVVDDAHWLDPASAGALLFCASRIGADRVVMVFATRDDAAATFPAPGVPELVLTGLGPDAARTLLGEHLEDAPAEEVTQRLIAETGGNPLALLELPTELTAAQLVGQSPLPAQLHLTARVEQVFLDRSRRLPADVQALLLLAAADDTGDVAVLRRAARSLGLDEHALEAAVGSGLLVEDGAGRRRTPPAGAVGDLPGRHG